MPAIRRDSAVVAQRDRVADVRRHLLDADAAAPRRPRPQRLQTPARRRPGASTLRHDAI